MAKEDTLYASIFMLFLGFLTFIMPIINKSAMFIGILDTYYVIFIFLGICIMIVGFGMILLWHFSNIKPYYVHPRARKIHFPAYLGSGAFLSVSGIIVLYYHRPLEIGLYILFSLISLLGISLMAIGLLYFVKEVVRAKKSLSHS